jgi:hypothetical protein
VAIDLRWRLAAERVVGADLVELDHPSIAGTLLGSSGSRRVAFELAQIPMHPLMPSVVLRASRPRAHQLDSEGEEPDRQLTQTSSSQDTHERRTVIRLNSQGKAVTLEETLQHLTDVFDPR